MARVSDAALVQKIRTLSGDLKRLEGEASTPAHQAVLPTSTKAGRGKEAGSPEKPPVTSSAPSTNAHTEPDTTPPKGSVPLPEKASKKEELVKEKEKGEETAPQPKREVASPSGRTGSETVSETVLRAVPKAVPTPQSEPLPATSGLLDIRQAARGEREPTVVRETRGSTWSLTKALGGMFGEWAGEKKESFKQVLDSMSRANTPQSGGSGSPQPVVKRKGETTPQSAQPAAPAAPTPHPKPDTSVALEAAPKAQADPQPDSPKTPAQPIAPPQAPSPALKPVVPPAEKRESPNETQQAKVAPQVPTDTPQPTTQTPSNGSLPRIRTLAQDLKDVTGEEQKHPTRGKAKEQARTGETKAGAEEHVRAAAPEKKPGTVPQWSEVYDSRTAPVVTQKSSQPQPKERGTEEKRSRRATPSLGEVHARIPEVLRKDERPISTEASSPTPRQRPKEAVRTGGVAQDAMVESLLAARIRATVKKPVLERQVPQEAPSERRAASQSTPSAPPVTSREEMRTPVDKAPSNIPAARELPVEPLQEYRATQATVAATGGRRELPAPLAAAATQAARRKRESEQVAEALSPRPFVIAGALMALIIVVGGPLVFWLANRSPQEVGTVTRIPTLIAIDAQEIVPFSENRAELLTELTEAVDEAGSGVTQIVPSRSLDAPAAPSASELFFVLDPRAPGSLLRSFGEEMMFGAVLDEPFFILTTRQYAATLAGMLEWEPFMSADLTPIYGEPVRRTLDSASRSADGGRPAAFADEQIGEVAVRTLYDEAGEARILYAIVDERTLLITASRDALIELIERL